jgi:hypothetical protein
MRMRQFNLVSDAVLWCVHFDEICSTIRRRHHHQVDVDDDVEDDARTPSPLPAQVVENTVV